MRDLSKFPSFQLPLANFWKDPEILAYLTSVTRNLERVSLGVILFFTTWINWFDLQIAGFFYGPEHLLTYGKTGTAFNSTAESQMTNRLISTWKHTAQGRIWMALKANLMDDPVPTEDLLLELVLENKPLYAKLELSLLTL